MNDESPEETRQAVLDHNQTNSGTETKHCRIPAQKNLPLACYY